jgi:hypothetical protein
MDQIEGPEENRRSLFFAPAQLSAEEMTRRRLLEKKIAEVIKMHKPLVNLL